jgi:phage baseplate assembly protein gpV
MDDTDNTVIPSFLTTSLRGAVKDNESLSSTSLRVGEIKEIIYPDDKRSISKDYIEYTVEAPQRDGGSTYSSTLYYGCVASQSFGGFADQLHYTLRQDEKRQGSKSIVGIGAKVLLMCINGLRSNAVILCGLPDSKFTDKDKDKHQKDKGHNLFFEFNGCQFSVNKDGEIELKFRGATKHDATLADGADAAAEGTSITINKDGNLKLLTPGDNQYFYINHKDKKIEMQAQSEWNVNVHGTVNINADAKVNIKSLGVNVGAATNHWLLADTYRTNETIKNSALSTNYTALAGMIGGAGAALAVAAPLNAIPIVGGLLAAPAFITASTLLLSTPSLFSAMVAATTAFEGAAPTYLSLKNLND